MIQEKKKWVIQKESSFRSSFLINDGVSLTSQFTLPFETNDSLFNSNYSSNYSLERQPTLEIENNHNHSFLQNQQIQLTITKKDNTISQEQSKTIIVNASDCPASLCYDHESVFCVDDDLVEAKPITSQFKVIFNGRVLSPALSFAFQGVKNGSELCIVPISQQELSPTSSSSKSFKFMNASQFIKSNFSTKNQREHIINYLHQRFNKQWSDKFRDSDSVFEQIRDSIDPTTSEEFARISDIKRLRAEEKSNVYQKVYQRYRRIEANSTIDNDKAATTLPPTIIPEKLLEPSSNPLPGLEMTHQLMKKSNFIMPNVTSPSSCRDRVFSDELFQKF